MICSLCVRRLSDCYELKFQIEQSEQLLLSVVSNRLFMGLSNEYSENGDQQSIKSNSIIDTLHQVVNDFESSFGGNEIIAVKSLQDDVPEVVHAVEPKDHPSEKRSASKSTFNCVICLKKFSTASKLDRHSVNQHLVRNDVNVHKPHQCDECPKSYTTKANLVLHRAVHTGKDNRVKFDFSNDQRPFRHQTIHLRDLQSWILQEIIAQYTHVHSYRHSTALVHGLWSKFYIRQYFTATQTHTFGC